MNPFVKNSQDGHPLAVCALNAIRTITLRSKCEIDAERRAKMKLINRLAAPSDN